MTSVDTTIREAAASEADTLSALALRSKAHWGYSYDFIESCRAELTYSPKLIESDNVIFVVAERLSVIAGFYALETLEGGLFELEALFVEPVRIGTGMGRLLLEHAIRKVETAGGKSLLIQGDPNAEGFYREMGGEPAGFRPSASIPGRTLPLFRVVV